MWIFGVDRWGDQYPCGARRRIQESIRRRKGKKTLLIRARCEPASVRHLSGLSSTARRLMHSCVLEVVPRNPGGINAHPIAHLRAYLAWHQGNCIIIPLAIRVRDLG